MEPALPAHGTAGDSSPGARQSLPKRLSKAWYLWSVDGICWSNAALVCESWIVGDEGPHRAARASTFSWQKLMGATSYEAESSHAPMLSNSGPRNSCNPHCCRVNCEVRLEVFSDKRATRDSCQKGITGGSVTSCQKARNLTGSSPGIFSPNVQKGFPNGRLQGLRTPRQKSIFRRFSRFSAKEKPT